MKTKVIKIKDKTRPEDGELLEAAEILRSGGLVAFPTETVYGLGANALDEAAAKKIYAAKGRPSDNPLIAHISSMEELPALVREIPEAGRKLAEKYWPGPLTMIFPKKDVVPYGTTGGLDTVAVRMPSDPVANRLIKLAGIPVAAPSANTSGRPSPTRAEHVIEDMDGKIEMILDGGQVGIGVESTIVDVSGPVPTLLRPGAVTLEMLRETLGQVEVDPAILGPVKGDVKPKAPGMKYRRKRIWSWWREPWRTWWTTSTGRRRKPWEPEREWGSSAPGRAGTCIPRDFWRSSAAGARRRRWPTTCSRCCGISMTARWTVFFPRAFPRTSWARPS